MNTLILPYRGTIQGLVSAGSHVAFITTHAESQPTALYRLDATKKNFTLAQEPLTCGATAIVSDGKNLWFAGQDHKLYQAPLAKGKPKARPKLNFEGRVLGLALLANDRMAVLQAAELQIINYKKNTVLQTFSYTESAVSLASSPDGLWLAVGKNKGSIAVYQSDDSQNLSLSAESLVHKGAVTALQFEADALRFYSAGTDKKLFSTHAQGNLEPLDRGKSSNHSANIQALHLGSMRFFTGASDRSIKSWPLAGGQPVTINKNLAKITAMVALTYEDRECLLVAGTDDTLRIVGLTADEKFTEVTDTVYDGYRWGQHYLASNKPAEREQGIAFLAGYDDKKSLAIIAKHHRAEKDKGVCEKTIALLIKSQHAESTPLLESLLKDNRHEGLRQIVFAGLLKRAKKDDLRPFEKALESGQLDIGREALALLLKQAKKNPQAEQLLAKTLHHKLRELRLLALSQLEKVYAKKSTKASLLALKSDYPDLQRAALIRLYQRNLLDSMDVKRAILLAQNHDDEQLRHTAFLVSIISQKELAKALRSRDEMFARQLQDLEDFELIVDKDTKTTAEVKKKTIALKASPLNKLDDDDYAVLLQSMTSQHLNVCFHAAYGLAVLQDQRAYGVLLSLAQYDEVSYLQGVCRAFALLNEQDAIPVVELLVNHKAPTVRDAAYSALEQLQNNALIVIEQGLDAKHEDIHARALKSLLDQLKKKLKKADKVAALALLKTALNDPFKAIRQESFKACLNRKLGGSEQETLALLLDSQHENVHAEVLNELMSKSRVKPVVKWVEPLLYDFFNNPFDRMRQSALSFALAEKKRFKEEAVLIAAISSEWKDTRLAVIKHIQTKPSLDNQQHLQQLLNDEDQELRNMAMGLLVVLQNKEAVISAMESPYDDVRVIAAMTLAAFGDQRAYPLLDQFLSTEIPNKKKDRKHWQEIIIKSLRGLEALSDTIGYDHVMRFLNNKDSAIVDAAAEALPWVTNETHTDALFALQKHKAKRVRAKASFALALIGNIKAEKLLKVHGDQYLSWQDQLSATFSMGEVTPLTLGDKLTEGNSTRSALLGLVAYELLLNTEEPKLTSWALGLNAPDVQLFCADLMTVYGDEESRWAHVQRWLIDAHSDEKWTISVETLKEIAAVIVYADGHTKARLFTILNILDQDVAIATWQANYHYFTERYAQAIVDAVAQVVPVAKTKPLQSLWNQRAFGTYLAQVRELERGRTVDVNMALKALRRLKKLAEQDAQLHSSVSSCFLTLLNHNYYPVRHFAIENLQVLGMDPIVLGKVATTSPQNDIAQQGLKLLITHYSARQSRLLLEELIQGDDAILTVEAYDLYREDRGLEKAASYALQSYNIELRTQTVHELAKEMSKKSQDLLVKAVANDESEVAIDAAIHLAKQAHTKAFALLSGLLKDNRSERQQGRILYGLKQLKDTKVASFLLDYIASNPLRRLEDSKLYKVIADYRDVSLFDALVARLETNPKEARWIKHALLKITGYDQHIEDYFDKSKDRSWLEKQYPRHDQLLVKLFTVMMKTDQKMAADLLESMAWSNSKLIDNSLLEAIPVIDSSYLPSLIKALAYRTKYRNSSVDGLLTLLPHKDLDIQFLAAESLALNGHHQGFAILLAAVDYQENDDYRQRAVLALGRSGDQRALDKLLKLAQEKEHSLNEVAIEAIGSMGDSEHADKIFKLLKSSLEKADHYSDMNQHALSGLRWFNSLAAWQLICRYIENDEHMYSDREHAVTLLKHWDTEAARALLLRLLKEEEDDDVCKAAYVVAQHLWKTPTNQTSEVDYALIQGHYPLYFDNKALKRIEKYAPTADLLDLLVADYADEESAEEILLVIDQSLLKRDDYTGKDLAKALESHSPRVINTIARLITRMETLSKTVQGHLEGALARYYQSWLDAYEQSKPRQLSKLEPAVMQLLWAAVKQGVIADTVTVLLMSQQKEQQHFVEHILKALLSSEKLPDASLLKPIEALLLASTPSISRLANQLMERHGKGEGIDWRHFQGRSTILMAPQFDQPLVDAAGLAEQQSLALPALIIKQDVATLMQVASDEQQQEAVRMGAIEGLARILTPAASEALSDINKKSDDSDISKAAYRALRRQQRSQQKADQLAIQAGV